MRKLYDDGIIIYSLIKTPYWEARLYPQCEYLITICPHHNDGGLLMLTTPDGHNLSAPDELKEYVINNEAFSADQDVLVAIARHDRKHRMANIFKSNLENLTIEQLVDYKLKEERGLSAADVDDFLITAPQHNFTLDEFMMLDNFLRGVPKENLNEDERRLALEVKRAVLTQLRDILKNRKYQKSEKS